MSSSVPLQPYDEHNQRLESNVHPKDWHNPTPNQPYHLVIIGAGTAGLVTAAGAAGLGARVALIERDLMGGDCLNVGCVPSKGLIAAARNAAAIRESKSFGIEVAGPLQMEFDRIMNRMREKRAAISPMDSADRFRQLGVDVYFGHARFGPGQSVIVEPENGASCELTYKKAVIATGARASAPPIPGLADVEYLTNENLFSLTQLPARFGVVGAGPIGCEMAQAFARLGSQVELFEMGERVLGREDFDAAEILQEQLRRDGVHVVLQTRNLQVANSNEGNILVSYEQLAESKQTNVDQLLVAVGRAPNVADLALDQVNVDFDSKGVVVNDFLQTTNPAIYAAGDVCSRFQFTHAADFQARIVIQNALFALGPIGRRKASDLLIPWCTYTSPEVAHVGYLPKQTQQMGIETDTYTQSFEHIDRAILEGAEHGFVKIHTRKGTDKIIGATVVGENAGDLICEVAVAMKNKLGLSQIASTIHPYPTFADAIRKIGDQYNKTKLTPFSARLLKLLMRLNVGT